MSQTVLVADDSRTIRKVVKMGLKVAPFEVISVGSGDEALRNARPDLALVILDYHFPQMSGYEVARQFKENAQTSDVPILMLAGDYHGFDEQQAKQAGVDRVIPKPFDTDTLLDAIVATTGVSKKALVKRQKGAPKTESPFSAEESDEPVSPKEPEPAGRGSAGSPPEVPGTGGGSDAGSNKPRFSTPSSGSGSAQESSPGAAQPGSGGGGAVADSGSGGIGGDSGSSGRPDTRPDSGAQQPGGANTGPSQHTSSTSSGGARLDLDLDSDPAEQEPAANTGGSRAGSGSNPRFRSPSSGQDEVGQGSSGGARRRRTPESQGGSSGDQPRSGSGGVSSPNESGAPGTGSSSAGGPSADRGGASGAGGLDSAGISRDELDELVEEHVKEHVKETVREQLPDLLRKIMGEVFEERVLPKVLDHGKQQVESLVQDQLDRRIHDEVRRQLDELLEDI